MSDKRLKSIYIYEYVFGDVEHKITRKRKDCATEKDIHRLTSHISCECEWHGDQNPAKRSDKDASGHVLSWSIAWETHWSTTIISPSLMSLHNRSTEDSETTLSERQRLLRDSLQSHRKLGLFGHYLFIRLPMFAHKSKYSKVCLPTCHCHWHCLQTDWRHTLQVFAYWICTWCSLSIDRLEFSTTKDAAPTAPVSSTNTETRSHYREISKTGKINKSKHSLNVLSIFSSMYLSVLLLYDHMLESFFLRNTNFWEDKK